MLPLHGLTSQEVAKRQKQFGSNTIPDTADSTLHRAIATLWTPVSWMLEAATILEFFTGHAVEGSIILVLLLFNGAISFFQEGQARATLKALQSRLALTAFVCRDDGWKSILAVDLVPGDIIKTSLGKIIPADARILEGNILLDQSMLTGESIPIEASKGMTLYTGSLVCRGEATAVVTATGMHTKFGHTAELVRSAHTVSSQQKAVLRIIRNLACFNGAIILLLLGYAFLHAMPLKEILPLALTFILASIPVALPATFTVGAALGAKVLAARGVLLTRLSAVDEAASMNLLCVDKTGTLTCNKLNVAAVYSVSEFDETTVLMMAALASSTTGQDPLDLAIQTAVNEKKTKTEATVLKFIPFDPETKMAEATVEHPTLGKLHIAKGAFDKIRHLTSSSSETVVLAEELEKQGHRVIAVEVNENLIGLIALSDPPRKDSAALIEELKKMGVRTIMATGDAVITATAVAKAVGLDLKTGSNIFAGILPEDKSALVKKFQTEGDIVGMCGDGANDAPALRQAQIGIAVSTATDVAKSAAGVVLTQPGLSGIVTSIQQGRIIFQRLLTYIICSITKKIVQVFFLCIGLFMTGEAILTPLLMILLMIIGDFLGMALTTDHVTPSSQPNAWNIGKLTVTGVIIGFLELLFCIAILGIGCFKLRLDRASLQTLAFVTLVFGHQAMTYSVRARAQLWKKPYPAHWLLLSSLLDIIIAITLASYGLLMAQLPLIIIGSVLISALFFALALDLIKRQIFRQLKII